MKSTVSTKLFNGTPCLVPNVVTEHEDFYISYNNHDVSIYGQDTTAIVVGQMQGFFILNGDHRENLPASWSGCLAYLRANKDDLNKMSDKLPDGDTIEEAIEACRIKLPLTFN